MEIARAGQCFFHASARYLVAAATMLWRSIVAARLALFISRYQEDPEHLFAIFMGKRLFFFAQLVSNTFSWTLQKLRFYKYVSFSQEIRPSALFQIVSDVGL